MQDFLPNIKESKMRKEELEQLEKSLRRLLEKVNYLSDEYMAIHKVLYVTINLIIDIEKGV
jgi:hypothetical protein